MAQPVTLLMSLKQCPGCDEMVDESKAYCPECGSPMDEEQRRSGASEYDSLMKTQNINLTSQLKLIEDFNLSSVFTPPKNTDEQNELKKEAPVDKIGSKTIQLQAIPEITTKNSQNEAAVHPAPSAGKASVNNKTDSAANSNKTLYMLGGLGIFILALTLIAFVTFAVLYWYNSK